MGARKPIQERIAELMNDIPELPKDFNSWIETKVMVNSNYIFYKKNGRKIHAVCSKCASSITLEKATHNAMGKCPNCKKRSTLKAINKAKYYEATEIVSIIQKMCENRYVVRYFKIRKTFKNGEDTSNFPNEILSTLTEPHYSIWEGSREIVTIKKSGKSHWESFEELWDYNVGEWLWKKERKRSIFFSKELLRGSIPFMYKRNIKRLLKNTKWKYSGLGFFKGTHMNIADYLATYEHYPAIEMVCKMGSNNLLRSIVDTCDSFFGSYGVVKMHQKFLGVSKTVFQRAIRMDINVTKIEFLATLEELNYNITDEQAFWAINNVNTETFIQLLKYISAKKIISYVEEQATNDTLGHILRSWRDYLWQCEELGLDLKKSYFMFPNNLEERHLEYTKLIKTRRNKEIEDGIKKTFDKWKDLDYKDGVFKLVVARNQQMIIAEGSSLGHCVGGSGYTSRMAKGTRLIIMIRKNNKPYSTIEFDPKRFEIIQNRGKNNKNMPDAVDFADKWLKKHVERIKKSKSDVLKDRLMAVPATTHIGGDYHERIAN